MENKESYGDLLRAPCSLTRHTITMVDTRYIYLSMHVRHKSIFDSRITMVQSFKFCIESA